MAADVTSSVRLMKSYRDDRSSAKETAHSNPSSSSITRDFLGISSNRREESKELDLEMEVPTGWEKRLDLKSGKLYLQKCHAWSSSATSDHPQILATLGDTSFGQAQSTRVTLNLFDDGQRQNSVSSPSSSMNSGSYQSVCTLDKVRSALSRAEKEKIKKRGGEVWKTSLSPSYTSSTSSSVSKTHDESYQRDNGFGSVPVAAGCPGCLSYVLVTTNSPICPRCSSVLPIPAMKKPKIDLNMSI